MAYLRLKRLKIEKYRSVVPGTELVFNDGMNVLLGRNGTGKTTLLQLIALVAQSRFRPLVGADFSIEYDLALEGFELRVTLVNQPSESSTDLLAQYWWFREGPRSDWSFSVSLLLPNGELRSVVNGTSSGVFNTLFGAERAKSVPVRDPLREAGPVEQGLDTLIEASNRLFLNEPPPTAATSELLANLKNSISMAQHHFERRPQGGRFDEGLGTFRTMTGGSPKSPAEDPAEAVLYWAEKTQTIFGGLIPTAVEKAVTARLQASEPSDLVLLDTELPFLRRALDLIGCSQGKMMLGLGRREELADLGKIATYSNFEFLLTMDDSTVLRHDWLSYGQKRLLSFLYYAAANPDIIIADELVNGLHHEWIEACLEEIKDRQCFLTSQNPLLLDYLSFDSVESVQRSFILCDRKKNGRRAQLAWGNIPEDAATSFFRAYKAGVQHVSEILRTKGLW